jgi:hypothetical protein
MNVVNHVRFYTSVDYKLIQLLLNSKFKFKFKVYQYTLELQNCHWNNKITVYIYK